MKWIIPLVAIAVALAGCANPDESGAGGNGADDGGGQQVDGTVQVVDPADQGGATNTTTNETNTSG